MLLVELSNLITENLVNGELGDWQQIGRRQEKNGGRHQEKNGGRHQETNGRSTPGDKWEVDTRRKASVTLSAKISAAISAKCSDEFTQISDNVPQISVNFKLGD